jgi:hypothetical protein
MSILSFRDSTNSNWKRIFHRLAVLLVLGFIAASAQAQRGAYGEFTVARISIPGANTLYGPTVGYFSEPWHFGPIHAGYDVRGIFLGNNGASLDSVIVGPRVSFNTHILDPYLQVGGGFGHGSTGGTNSDTENKFEYQFLAGVDAALLPRIRWRVVEFSYGALSGLGSSFNPKTLSTGIVINLP